AEHLLDDRIVGPELLAEVRQARRQRERLELVVDGGVREEVLLETRELRVAVLAEARLVRLGELLGRADGMPRVAEGLRREAAALREEGVGLADLAHRLLRGGDGVPSGAVILGLRGIGGDARTERLLRRDLAREELAVEQRLVLTLDRLQAVLVREQLP